MNELIKKKKAIYPRPIGTRQIYEGLRDQILDGVFGTNGMLPSSRSLAYELGVSRTTITTVYEQLKAEGFIEVRQGARPKVASVIVNYNTREHIQIDSGPESLSPYGKRIQSFLLPPPCRQKYSVADLKYGDVSTLDFPTRIWKRAMSIALDAPPGQLTYDDPRGLYRLRIALQGYLWRARMIHCEPEQIIITNGSQQGLDICSRLLLGDGDNFIMENPGYIMAYRSFASSGAKHIPIPVDNHGLDVDQMINSDARLAYVTPSHQFPLGGVLPVTRRQILLEWALRNNAYIIEDDYDSEYRYDTYPIPPLYGQESSKNVIYLGTLSKTLAPSLRLGYLVVPPKLKNTFVIAKEIMDRHSPITNQIALAIMIENGTYESHVRHVRLKNKERRNVLLSTLYSTFGEDIKIDGEDAGLHIVIWFKKIPAEQENILISLASSMGLGIYAITPLYNSINSINRKNQAGLILGYAALDTRKIKKSIEILKNIVYSSHFN